MKYYETARSKSILTNLRKRKVAGELMQAVITEFEKKKKKAMARRRDTDIATNLMLMKQLSA